MVCAVKRDTYDDSDETMKFASNVLEKNPNTWKVVASSSEALLYILETVLLSYLPLTRLTALQCSA